MLGYTGRNILTAGLPGMPDYVYSTMKSGFTNKFRELILPYDCESAINEDLEEGIADAHAVDKIKQFDIDMSKGAVKNVDLIPPPSFSQGDVPFQYMYVCNSQSSQKLSKIRNLLTPTN